MVTLPAPRTLGRRKKAHEWSVAEGIGASWAAARARPACVDVQLQHQPVGERRPPHVPSSLKSPSWQSRATAFP